MIKQTIIVTILIILAVSNSFMQTVPIENTIRTDSLNTFYVVGHDWHTGIIIHTADIPDSLRPRHHHFPQTRYLEIGWGDKDFYQNPSSEIDYYLAIKAALWPTESVLHINGFDKSVEEYYYFSELIRFEISLEQFKNLYLFIFKTFARDSVGNEIWIGKGHYNDSQFFLGEDKYYFPKTCNVWTAQAINRAGFDISPFRFQTAENLIDYLHNIGEYIPF
ncbi:DUF2459 domain-containing protein [Calditrichota bacterium]